MENADSELHHIQKKRGFRAFFSTLFETIPEEGMEGTGIFDDDLDDDFGSILDEEDLDSEWLEDDEETGEAEGAEEPGELFEELETESAAVPEKTEPSAAIVSDSIVHPIGHPDIQAFLERGRSTDGQKEHVYQPLVSRYDRLEQDTGASRETEQGIIASELTEVKNPEDEIPQCSEEDGLAEELIPDEEKSDKAIQDEGKAEEAGEEKTKEQAEEADDTEQKLVTKETGTEVPEEAEGLGAKAKTDSVSPAEEATGSDLFAERTETKSPELGTEEAEDGTKGDLETAEAETIEENKEPEESGVETGSAPENQTKSDASDEKEGEKPGDSENDLREEGKTAYQPLVSRYDSIQPESLSDDAKPTGIAEIAGEKSSETGEDSKEEIRLFEEEQEESYAHFGDTGRMRSVRTGLGTTTRIHLNQTEEMQREEAAQQRAEEIAKAEQESVKKERRNRRTRIMRIVRKLFSNVAFVLFLIAAVLIAVYYAFLLSDVIIVGNQKYSSDYIVGISGLQEGRHMLMIDMEEAKAKIEDNPYLEVESMTYIFPNRIRVVIKERQEVAGIVGVDYSIIIDDQGYVLSMAGGTDLSNLLRVTGVSMTGFQLGQKLGEGNDFSTATLVQIIQKLEEYKLIDRISAIDLTTPLAITMTARNGLNIHLGQSTDLDEKMNSLSKLIDAFTEKYISTGTLYLSAKGGTVYSPSDAAKRAAEAAIQANIPSYPEEPEIGSGWIDEDEDGYDDNTGNPLTTPAPTPPPATPAPTPIAGGSDEFSG